MINQLINAHLIQLDLQANNKQAVFEELIDILHSQGRISDKAAFLQDIQAREELGNTGFEDGGDNHHIEVLAELSSKLIEEGFIEAFLNTRNSEQALELLLKKSTPTPLANQTESKGLIIGVTGCPAGIVLGGMAGFDMGGPFNKVAFLFSVGMIASGQTQFMGAMACAIPVAPLGMALATAMGRKLELFESSELEAGKAAGAMGLVGISESAITFAAQDPMSVIPANVLCSMVAAVMAFSFGITNSVAHGGPVVALLGAMNYPMLALLCMAAGAGVTAITCVTLKKISSQKFEATAA